MPELRHVHDTRYPLDTTSRDAERQSHRERILAKAEAEATLYGRSIRCRETTIYGTHAAWPEPGCANDGCGCLCPCHDQPTEGVPDA